MTVEILGIDECIKKLEQMGADVPFEIADSAKNAMIMTVEKDAKNYCPVDEGELRASIHTSVLAQTPDYIAVATGPYAKHGIYVEYGTGPHTPPFKAIQAWATRKGMGDAAGAIWNHIKHNGTAPHPFMRPAYEGNKKRVVDLLKRDLARKVKEAAKR